MKSVSGMAASMRSVMLRRLARLRRYMESSDLSALILFEGDSVAHKLSLTQHFDIVLVTLDEVYVLADAALYHEAARESPWRVVLVENFGLDQLVKEISSLLGRDVSRMRLGVNKMWGRARLTYLYMDLLDALRSRGIEVVDATPMLTEVFDKPYEEEISIIKWISEATSKALEAAYEYLKPGIRECELASVIDRVLDENGIVDRWFSTIVASGPRAASPHAKTSTRRIGYGEPVVVDIGPFWMGYDGCAAHTFIAGQSRYWEDILEKVKQALELGLDHAKPGTPVRILDEVPRSELKKHSFPEYPHLTGHPIGGFYKPVIAEFIDYTLETNMVFAYEPAVYIPNRGGVRIEPHVLITSSSYETLTEFHRELLTD